MQEYMYKSDLIKTLTELTTEAKAQQIEFDKKIQEVKTLINEDKMVTKEDLQAIDLQLSEIKAQINSKQIIIKSNFSNNATLPNAYEVGKITIESLSMLYMDTQVFPTKEASTLTTTTINTNYSTQQLSTRSGNIYIRTGIENVWSGWKTYSREINAGQFSWSFTSVPAKGQVETIQTMTGCNINDFALVNPKTILPAGLIYNAFVVSENIVKIRICNITDVAISDSGRNWAIKVIKQ